MHFASKARRGQQQGLGPHRNDRRNRLCWEAGLRRRQAGSRPHIDAVRRHHRSGVPRRHLALPATSVIISSVDRCFPASVQLSRVEMPLRCALVELLQAETSY